MQETHSRTGSARESLSNLTSLRGSGYTKLPTCNCANNDLKNGFSKDFSSYRESKSSSSRSKPCMTAFFSLLYRFLIAFLRVLCFRLPRNIDNESLLTVEYKGECTGEDQACEVILVQEIPVARASPKNSYVEISSTKNGHVESQCKVLKPNSTTVAVSKIKASQVKGKVIASKGKDQLTATKAVVDRSKQQLREVCDDVSSIRSDIEAAKKLFTEVEKGIKEYKWDTFARETWAAVECNGELTYFPVSSAPYYLNPYQKMYSDHRIFIEEMKYHFKWNHGILL